MIAAAFVDGRRVDVLQMHEIHLDCRRSAVGDNHRALERGSLVGGEVDDGLR